MKNPKQKNDELNLADQKEALEHLKAKKKLAPFEKVSFDIGRQAAIECLKMSAQPEKPESIEADEILAQLHQLIEQRKLTIADANRLHQAFLQKAQKEVDSIK